MAILAWRHYGDLEVAPLCRSRNGAIGAVADNRTLKSPQRVDVGKFWQLTVNDQTAKSLSENAVNWAKVVESPQLDLGEIATAGWIDLFGKGTQSFCRRVGSKDPLAPRFFACRAFTDGRFATSDTIEVVR